MDINNVTLTGRLTKDVEIRLTNTNKKCTTITLACNRDKENADFINVVLWEKTAELVEKYCGKGSKLGITGRIQTRNFKDKNDKTVYITEVLAREITFLDTKNATQGENTQPKEENGTQSDFVNSTFDIASDDLPF